MPCSAVRTCAWTSSTATSRPAAAWVDALGGIVFLLPLCVVIIGLSLGYVADAWAIRESSPEPGGIPYLYLLKTLLPLMAINLAVAGIADILRNALTLVGDGDVPGGRGLMHGSVSLWMFAAVCLLLMFGYPVAFTLAGTALVFAAVGTILGAFDPDFLAALPGRLFGTVSNVTLIAVPLFVLMGVVLEKSRVAEELLDSMAALLGRLRGGLAISVVLVGTLLAASTGIVGATVVTMGLLSLPSMLRAGYGTGIATGTICATGTLGQIIPPSIALVLLGDILSSAYQQAQLELGVFNPQTVSVGDLFVGAIVPGLILVALYCLYLFTIALLRPNAVPPVKTHSMSWAKLLDGLLPPLLLITVVLGSILAGAATPTEAAGVGATGALILAALRRELTRARLQEILENTLEVTAMVFMILIGAAVFSLVFPRLRRRGADRGILHHATRRCLCGDAAGDGRDLHPRLCPRLYRDHLRGRAHRRANPADDGSRSDLARHHDRHQSADLVPDAALRLRPVLPARRGPGKRPHGGHLPRRDTLYRHSAAGARGPVDLARAGDLAPGPPVSRGRGQAR
jgi:tripartite ATP-independent transporter DctM subunit